MKKSISCAQAVEMIPEGASIMVGGFMGVGSPHRLIDELVRQNKRNLTIYCNDAGRPGLGVAKLVDAKLVKKLIATHIGLNPEAQRQMVAGEMEVELIPQGTFAEQIRAGGYGLGGILTATGIGTVVAEGKRTVEVDGKMYLLEKPLRADFALVGAHRADYRGNLEYLLTARNFNMVMAMAADKVIAEPHQIVPVGMIPPDCVGTPFVCVHHIIERGQYYGG
jgi:acetate CoA/acetoacetate CoA-transferase alpha subunit